MFPPEQLMNASSLSKTLNPTLRGLAQQYAQVGSALLGDRLLAVALFGSVARGEAGPLSDIDLFVVIRDAPAGMFRRSALLVPVREQLMPLLRDLWQREIYVDFSEVIRSDTELQYFHPLFLDLATQALVLFDQRGLLSQTLDALRRKLESGQIVQRWVDGIRYWDLRPERDFPECPSEMTGGDANQRTLQRAALILEEARSLNGKEAWNLVVRRCQEAVELALKGALLWADIQVPRVHDVGPVLSRNSHRFPPEFQALVPRLAVVSHTLAGKRETSFYGDEASGLPPEALYTERDAAEALAATAEVLEACRTLIAPTGGQPQ